MILVDTIIKKNIITHKNGAQLIKSLSKQTLTNIKTFNIVLKSEELFLKILKYMTYFF